MTASAGPARDRWRLPRRLQSFIDSRSLLVLETALLLAMTLSVVTQTWQDRMWLGFLLAGVTFAAWTPELFRARVRRWWFAYVAGIFAYTLLRALADETFIPIQTDYVIEVDQALFFGTHPVTRLQDQFFSRSAVDAIDFFGVLVHWSFFVAPHAMAIGIFLWRRPLFGHYTAVVVGTMYLGLILFFLVPTTPPWLAGLQGDLAEAYRVMDYVGAKLNGDAYQDVYASLGEPNSVAAMPSIHMGVTFAMYLWSREHARRYRWPLLAYTGVMGLALVYLAEHYVFDLVGGILCALAAYLLARPLSRAANSPAVERSARAR
jgi:hypothetical protein